MPTEVHPLKDQIAHIATDLGAVSQELREISRGLHPAVLSKGLAPALKTLARRSAVPVELDIGVDVQMPERVEVEAYYVAAEALTNAAKHARASKVDVCVDTEGVPVLSWHHHGHGWLYHAPDAGPRADHPTCHPGHRRERACPSVAVRADWR